MGGLDGLVIGSGVSGLTTAVCLAEAGLRVGVHTAAPPAATTSAAAGALWMPYLAEPQERVASWSARTLTQLRELAGDPATGVRLASGTELSTGPGEPAWTGAVGATRCPPGSLPPGFPAGWRFTTALVEMPVYLAYLVERLRRAGGQVEQQPVASLAAALATTPLVVNCAGIGARELVPDPRVRPVRGQVVVVENPGLDEFLVEAPGPSTELRYVLPHRNTVVLGGTAELDDADLTPRPEVAHRIVARCAELVPALAGARVVAHRVGLRPFRDQVRLELETRDGGRVIHNYGHGGSGVTVSWGCAQEVTDRARSG